MMMSLGSFVFHISNVAYQSITHKYAQRFASNNRIGVRPAQQFMGADEETITLSGILLPEFTGASNNLTTLRHMSDTGNAWVLLSGQGAVLGVWVIKELSETQTIFMQDGTARKSEFTLSLIRVDDNAVETLGDIGFNLPQSNNTL